jgi:hypothetical protein
VVRDVAGNPTFDAAGMLRYDFQAALLTRDAVSPSIGPGQVLSSIIMFAVVYLLLFWVWVYVLNDKIQKGPHPVRIDARPHGGWWPAAAGRAAHQESLSEAKDERPPEA